MVTTIPSPTDINIVSAMDAAPADWLVGIGHLFGARDAGHAESPAALALAALTRVVLGRALNDVVTTMAADAIPNVDGAHREFSDSATPSLLNFLDMVAGFCGPHGVAIMERVSGLMVDMRTEYALGL